MNTGAVRRIVTGPAVFVIRCYQKMVSPFLGRNCRFSPSCSEYAVEALKTHGLLRGSGLALRRIGRCNPLGPSGYDPVPGIEEGKDV